MAIVIDDKTAETTEIAETAEIAETGGEWASRLDGMCSAPVSLPLRCERSTRRPSTGSCGR